MLLFSCDWTSKKLDIESLITSSDTTIVIFLSDMGCAACDAYMFEAVKFLGDRKLVYIYSGNTRRRALKELTFQKLGIELEPDVTAYGHDQFNNLIRIVDSEYLRRSNVLLFLGSLEIEYSLLKNNRPQKIESLQRYFRK